MKKFILLNLFLTFIYSCQTDYEDIKLDISETNSKFETKALNTNIDPVWELFNGGIPFNIKTKAYKPDGNIYLSVNNRDKVPDLFNRDDSSLRQRWMLEFVATAGYKLRLQGGGPWDLSYLINLNGNGVGISNIGTFDRWGFEPIGKTPNYYIHSTNFGITDKYLKSENSSSSKIIRGIKDDRAIWEIVPVEEFKVLDMKYDQVVSEGDMIAPYPEQVDNIIVPNTQNPNEVEQIYNYTHGTTETSKFSKAEGITLTGKINTSFKVGIPIINAEGGISSEQTTSKTWSYTEENQEQKTKSVNISFSTKIPPYSHAVIKIYVMKYNITVTYVATLQGLTTGRTFKVKGKWSGIEATDYYYEPIITYPNGNTEILEKVKITVTEVTN